VQHALRGFELLRCAAYEQEHSSGRRKSPTSWRLVAAVAAVGPPDTLRAFRRSGSAPTSRCTLSTTARQAWACTSAVVQRGSSSPREHVDVVNDGAEPVPVPVTGLELTDCCGQHHEHVYSFAQGEFAAGQTPRLQREPAHAHR